MTLREIFRLLLIWVFLTGCTARHQLPLAAIEETPVQKIRVNRIELGYKTMGKGPALLMIMGYAGTMETWDPRMLLSLSKSYRLILFDNRGTGHSGMDDSELTIAGMAADAAGLLDGLGIEKAHVMGWSMGSLIAQEMALAYPDQVSKVILYGTAVDPKPVKQALDHMAGLPPEEFAARLFPRAWREQNPGIYQRLPGPADVSGETIQKQYQAMVNWKGTRTRLDQVATPVLILTGEADRITPLSQNLAAAALIPGAWVVRFKSADHWLMYQAPEAMAGTIDFFLSAEQNLLRKSPPDPGLNWGNKS